MKRMGETILVDIINEKALNVLEGLEILQLIRLRKGKEVPSMEAYWAAKYKKAMSQQPLHEIDEQINKLRSAWE